MPLRSRSSSASILHTPERRSIAFSYLFWCLSFLGFCGIHRFYNRKPISGLLWFFTIGLCGIGQLIDLFLIPEMVSQANMSLLQATADAQDGAPALPSIEKQLLQLARRVGRDGFTINDALLELNLAPEESSETVRGEIERLLHAGLLDVGNDERGRVIYFEP
jgi:TM2 domain-containing membrane protein YozV